MSSELGRRVAVVALAAALSLTVLAEPSFAGHGGEANSGTPDNADHFVDRNSVTGKWTMRSNMGSLNSMSPI